MTPGGETCTADSGEFQTKVDHWDTLPAVLSHSIKVDAYVDGLVDGLQIANRDFHSPRGRCRYGWRPWNGVGGSPICRRVRGRGVVGGLIQSCCYTLLPKPRARGETRH